MRIGSIASGSEGNCIYIGSDTTHLLVDVGISGKRVRVGLDVYGIKLEEIHGVLITHEHIDHIKGLVYWQESMVFLFMERKEQLMLFK